MERYSGEMAAILLLHRSGGELFSNGTLLTSLVRMNCSETCTDCVGIIFLKETTDLWLGEQFSPLIIQVVLFLFIHVYLAKC